MISIISLLRPQQWVKNLVVFMPPFFGAVMYDAVIWLRCIVAFCCFCLASGAVYCLNDVMDRESDRKHPHRCNRPVASGRVSVSSALTIGVICGIGALVIAFWGMEYCRTYAVTIVAAYMLLNIAYCLRLKQVAVLDVFIVSSGYVLRLFIGGVACGVVLSPWIVLVTFLFTMFLTMAKRRSDVVLRESVAGHSGRRSTQSYTLAFVNAVLGILATATIVCYMIYTVTPDVTARLGSPYVYGTSVFVLFGLLRYLQLAIVDGAGDNPVRLMLTDYPLLLCAAGWLVSFVVIIYF